MYYLPWISFPLLTWFSSSTAGLRISRRVFGDALAAADVVPRQDQQVTENTWID